MGIIQRNPDHERRFKGPRNAVPSNMAVDNTGGEELLGRRGQSILGDFGNRSCEDLAGAFRQSDAHRLPRFNPGHILLGEDGCQLRVLRIADQAEHRTGRQPGSGRFDRQWMGLTLRKVVW